MMKAIVTPWNGNERMTAAEWNSTMGSELPFTVQTANWKGFPQTVSVRCALVRTQHFFFLKFKVDEPSVRAVNGLNGQSVWEDSCVEFFIRPKGSDDYFNFETNAIGTLLIQQGRSRTNREVLSSSQMESVDTFSTLGKKPFEEKAIQGRYEVALKIPLSLLFNPIPPITQRLSIQANFYKCGDRLKKPHFLTWAPILTPAPDFHRPEFFADICFLPKEDL